jgi:hypothetical protein
LEDLLNPGQPTRTKYLMWVVFGIYLTIFINSYVFFTNPFEFQFGYIFYLLLLPGYISRHPVNRNLVYVFLTLFATGLLNVLAGNNNFDLFVKVFAGVALSYFFYYFVIVEYKFDIERLFKWYLAGAYFASLLGIFQFVSYQIGYESGYFFWHIFNKWAFAPGGLFGIRVNSIFSEPTHLACVLSPAFFVSVYNIFRKKQYLQTRFRSAVIIFVYVISFSGLGQTGIFITLVLLAVNLGLVRYILIAIPLSILLFNFLYTNVVDFRDRLDSLVSLFSGEQFDLKKTHGSSFVLYNNYVVATENFETNYVFGSGLGSHAVAFDKYSKAKHIKTFGFNLNSADANSMFLRLLSETGLFGIGLFLFLVFRCYISKDQNEQAEDSRHWIISNALLVMILLNLFRQGHYFLNGFPFFVLLYWYNHQSYLAYVETGSSELGLDAPEEERGITA